MTGQVVVRRVIKVIETSGEIKYNGISAKEIEQLYTQTFGWQKPSLGVMASVLRQNDMITEEDYNKFREGK